MGIMGNIERTDKRPLSVPRRLSELCHLPCIEHESAPREQRTQQLRHRVTSHDLEWPSTHALRFGCWPQLLALQEHRKEQGFVATLGHILSLRAAGYTCWLQQSQLLQAIARH